MLTPTIHLQANNSYLYTIDNYFPSDYADLLFNKCREFPQIEESKIQDYLANSQNYLIINPQMRMGLARRCMGFFSDVSEGYEFSNQTMLSQKMPGFLDEFMVALNTSLKTEFNGLLINWYKDGSDNNGAHSDNEKGLYNGMVAAVTLMNPGGTRNFYIRDKSQNDKIILKVPTRHNQLLVMGGDFQKHYKHEIPKELRNTNAERVSITARYHRD